MALPSVIDVELAADARSQSRAFVSACAPGCRRPASMVVIRRAAQYYA